LFKIEESFRNACKEALKVHWVYRYVYVAKINILS